MQRTLPWASSKELTDLSLSETDTLVGSSISESKKYSRSPLTKNLYFINTEGEHVDHIELPSSKKNSDQPIQPFTIKPVLIDEASVITLSNQSAAAEENEENIEDSSAAKADIPSAFYEVTGFQPMKIAIATDDNGTILGVRVIEHGETPGFGADLIDHAPTFEKLVDQSIFTAQIDIRSGATLTSRAINEALKQAAAN